MTFYDLLHGAPLEPIPIDIAVRRRTANVHSAMTAR
jgi:hypothetical protein